MQILLASSNAHKIKEIQAIIEVNQIDDLQIISLDQFGQTFDEPVEDQLTFEQNAILKAKYYAQLTKMLCLADDSGLEVDALNGEPGIYSARYADHQGGRERKDHANNQKLLNKLGDLPTKERTARFVCAMALCAPSEAPPEAPPLAVVRGTLEGRILGPGDHGYDINNPLGRGCNGFGYDPLFIIPELGQTTAEISPSHKNEVSHRAQATQKMITCLIAQNQINQILPKTRR